MTELVEEAREQLAAHVGIKRSCELTGINRATRRANPQPKREDRAFRPAPPNRLSPAEREQIIATLNSEQFRDKSPRHVWAALARYQAHEDRPRHGHRPHQDLCVRTSRRHRTFLTTDPLAGHNDGPRNDPASHAVPVSMPYPLLRVGTRVPRNSASWRLGSGA